MNVTFLIGNGFDRNLGLATTYAEFIKVYKIIPTRSPVIEAFRQHIDDNKELWSAAEIALGKYTAELGSGGGADFSECHIDICEELAKYLKSQQELVDYRIAPEKAQNALANLNTIAQSFPTQEKAELNEIFTKHKHEGITFNFVNFNYTDTLDTLLEFAKKKPEVLGSHKYSGRTLNHTIGNICHVHGTVDAEMVFGVNDESQIAKNDVFECEDGDLYKSLLIKRQANAAYLENTDAKVAKILSDSHLIYIYGMSIGETDKLWWNRICEWLNGSTDRHLIIQKHALPSKSVLPTKYQLAERAAKKNITSHCNLDESKKRNIEMRIHVTSYNVFDAINNIALTEKEKAVISYATEFIAEEMDNLQQQQVSLL